MKFPKRIQPLIEDGLVDEVICQLMSGKEAMVYMVRSGSEIRCAKVYKEANKRSFKKAAEYREGRKGRNSRRNRAMEKGSKFGRGQQEEAWQHAEANALQRLANAGVRVPKPYQLHWSILLFPPSRQATALFNMSCVFLVWKLHTRKTQLKSP